MADYNISAEITADASGFESGVKKAQKASKNLSKSVSGVIQGLGKSGLVGALGAVGLATGGVVTVLNTVTKVAKKVAQTVDECSQAYRKQYQAEIALTTAVNNNPYVDGSAVKRLKDFASEMQRVSDLGDEELLPMMADLIAKGRTEEETMQLVSVAIDMSAGGTMSLDAAITQLNATLNGNIGRLGQQNAELKDLTAEELKQGKAVEILGAKYKGLAQATADSQKQLRNAIGDLKENIGQIFEQALAPMRKFFTEVITNLNESITKSRQLKTAMKEVFGDNGEVNLGASTDALNTAFTEVLHKQQEITRNYQQYIQLYGKYIDVATDETALSYKAQISDLNAQLKAISEELNKRRRESEEEKKRLAKEKADAEAQIELEKQKEIEAERLKIQTEWQDKLFAIRIENLERTRERELENEELTEEQKIAISKFYGDQILIMKIKQIEKERDEALKDEKLTEEARKALILYYENRITQAKDDEEKKRLKAKKKALEEEKKEEKKSVSETLKAITEYTKQYSKKIVDTFKKVVSTIKNVISSVVNIFSKMFDFNIDDALDNLLKVEDAILTFFVDTLPRLPSFMSSVVYSIKTLLKTVKTVLQGIDLKGVITSVLSELSNNLPEMVSDLLDILVLLVDGAVDSLVLWVTNGNGLQVLLDLILKIQTTIEKLVTDNIDKIVTMLEGQIENIADFIARSMASANRTLPKIIQAILRLIKVLIDVIAKAFENDDFVNSIVDSLIGVIDEIINILPKLITSIVKLIFAIINALIPKLPEIVSKIVTEIGKILSTDTGEILKAITDGIAGLLKKVFTLDFWISLLSSFGEALGQIIYSAFKNLNLGSIFRKTSGGGGGGSQTGSSWGDAALGIATGGVSTFGHHLGWWAKGTNAVPKGLSIVGEAGPELVRFNGGEQVLNNRNTNKALAGMGGKNITNNITFNNLQDTTAFAMMNQFKAYNRQLAINGVI